MFPPQLVELLKESPVLGLLLCACTLCELILGSWVVRQVLMARAEFGALPAAARDLRAIQRAEIWHTRIRPWLTAIMIVAPGLGLMGSTLRGANGVGALGRAVAGAASPETLRVTLSEGFREVSFAYYLLVLSVPAMILTPLITAIAHRIETDDTRARGGDTDDQVVSTLSRIYDQLERVAPRAHAAPEAPVRPASAAPEDRR